MRKLGKWFIIHQNEWEEIQEKTTQKVANLKREIEVLKIDATPQYIRDRELLRMKIREEGIEEKLGKAPRLDPRNWDKIYKPWLENLREYFYADTKIN